MADLSVLLTAPVDFTAHNAPASNTAVAANQPADAGGATLIVAGITISTNGQPTAAVLATLVTDHAGANAILWEGYLPAVAFAPIDINFKNPLRGIPGKDVQLNVPALGVSISGTGSIRGFIRQE